MKKTLFKTGVLAVLLIISGCGTTLKRHASSKKSATDNDLVKISMLSTSVSDPAAATSFKTVFDLSDRGQSTILANRSIEQTSEILNKKFQNQTSKPKTIDLTSKNVRITFSISRDVSFDKSDFDAFDRIENLEYKVELSPADVKNEIKFEKWNKYTTEYGTLDIGTLEYNQSFNANLDVTGEMGASYSSKEIQKADENNSSENSTVIGPKVSATGKVGYSQSKKENQSIKQRFIQLTGKFNKESFSIHQHGNRETELAGNVSLDLTINFPKDEMIIESFANLFDEKYNSRDLKDVILNQTRYYVPLLTGISDGVKGKLNFKFVVRHIVCGANTYAEFDDRVQYITGEGNVNDVVLVKKDDLTMTTYYLTLDNKPLQINGSKTLQFLDYTDASELKTWLMRTLENFPDNKIIEISNNKIAFTGLSTKEMKQKKNEMKIIVAKN